MIELEQVPDTNIIILTAQGKITGDDYENNLVPAIEALRNQYDKLRLLYILGSEYDGYEAEAMWDDTKVGMTDFTHFEKLGVVTNKKWIRGSIKAFGFLIPGEVKLFGTDQLDEANSWIRAEA
jgi:hypothetical protein